MRFSLVSQSQRAFQSRENPVLLPPMKDTRLLGRILMDMGAITAAQLDYALEQQRRIDAKLGDIFLFEGMITPAQLQSALAQQHGLAVADLKKTPPSESLRTLMSADHCLRHTAVPWKLIGDILLVATAHPDRFEALKADRKEDARVVLPVLCEEEAICSAIETLHGPQLAERAETYVPSSASCRHMGQYPRRRAFVAGFILTCMFWTAFLLPQASAIGLAWLAVGTMVASILLKLSAGIAQIWHQRRTRFHRHPDITPIRLPRVSVMVPLLREKEITGALIERLSHLTYPKALLDVVLVLEADDEVTQDTLSHTKLPPWMRVIEVPTGSGLTTKPRALNYALDFCRSGIVGVWDAEDAPEPDQIEKIVNRFHTAPRDVICLQGQLDYYNPRDNLIARCFSIEYATWWRLVMPGLARLGMVIPLGGTTLFFRRAELEQLGRWDAHNVTEDADLGLRLARAGYRTELIETVTYEEANCRAWPWIRQRSRWLKGFAITWAVHMRNPIQLWRDLGTYQFVGVQLFYLTALSQFILAPVFWAFWLAMFVGQIALTEPVVAILGPTGFVVGFVMCEIAALGLHILSVSGRKHRHLVLWTPAMSLYFVMASIAMYKALYELISRPFFWDKTQHGVSGQS